MKIIIGACIACTIGENAEEYEATLSRDGNPEELAAFMENVKKPWIAFKVMAAGSIRPRMAFPYVFRHGADFIVAGMFDFQVESDVKITIESLQNVKSRKRPWYG